MAAPVKSFRSRKLPQVTLPLTRDTSFDCKLNLEFFDMCIVQRDPLHQDLVQSALLESKSANKSMSHGGLTIYHHSLVRFHRLNHEREMTIERFVLR
jgi:hypothetical protein